MDAKPKNLSEKNLPEMAWEMAWKNFWRKNEQIAGGFTTNEICESLKQVNH